MTWAMPSARAATPSGLSRFASSCQHRIAIAWKRLRRGRTYRKTWGSRVGQDCISLDASLCEWLAERLAFLAQHHHSYPADSTPEEYRLELLSHAMAMAVYPTRWDAETQEAEEALIAQAQHSLHWIADHLPGLWD
jgi:hypothetical protein